MKGKMVHDNSSTVIFDETDQQNMYGAANSTTKSHQQYTKSEFGKFVKGEPSGQRNIGNNSSLSNDLSPGKRS